MMPAIISKALGRTALFRIGGNGGERDGGVDECAGNHG
jgi:hypothetical protein